MHKAIKNILLKSITTAALIGNVIAIFMSETNMREALVLLAISGSWVLLFGIANDWFPSFEVTEEEEC